MGDFVGRVWKGCEVCWRGVKARTYMRGAVMRKESRCGIEATVVKAALLLVALCPLEIGPRTGEAEPKGKVGSKSAGYPGEGPANEDELDSTASELEAESARACFVRSVRL
jgi:hypothetical protein